MELKKFEAPTLSEALQVIKKELGPDAVIISTKNIRSSFGLMNRSSVEVTAAINEDSLDVKRAAESRLSEGQRRSLLSQPSHQVARAYDVLSGKRLTRALQGMESPSVSQRIRPSNRLSAPASRPQASITQRRYIDILDDESPAEKVGINYRDRTSIGATARNSKVATEGVFPKVLAMLLESGVSDEHIKKLGDELKALILRDHIVQGDSAKMAMAHLLMSKIRVAKSLSERLRNPANPRMITFIGPTGVGKTTTLAKIAAELVMQRNQRVTLATTDTFKIAAVEQLQTYANILRLPLEVCPNAESLNQLAENIGSDEVVLVDTAGYGPRDLEKLNELKETLSGIKMEIHLCVSATTTPRDVSAIAARFKEMKPNYAVVTKVDETLGYGNIFNLAQGAMAPLSYLTMGQRVPEDIEVASKERIADLVLNISGEGI